jgi:hypothetical protein
VPTQQSIRRNDRLQFEQSLASHRLGFPRQQRSLGVGEPDTLSAQPVFEQPVLGLEQVDDPQLMAMDQPETITSRNDSSGGTEPMPPVYRTPRLNCWTLRLTSHCLGFPREQSSLGVGEPDTLAAQPVFEQPVLGLKEFDDDQLMAMNPTSRDHQQKREQRRHGTHDTSLSHASAELLDTTGAMWRPYTGDTAAHTTWTARRATTRI